MYKSVRGKDRQRKMEHVREKRKIVRQTDEDKECERKKRVKIDRKCQGM